MTDVSKCQNDKCINKDNCYRFAESKGELMAMENVCNEDNKYKYLILLHKDIVKEEN